MISFNLNNTKGMILLILILLIQLSTSQLILYIQHIFTLRINEHLYLILDIYGKNIIKQSFFYNILDIKLQYEKIQEEQKENLSLTCNFYALDSINSSYIQYVNKEEHFIKIEKTILYFKKDIYKKVLKLNQRENLCFILCK